MVLFPCYFGRREQERKTRRPGRKKQPLSQEAKQLKTRGITEQTCETEEAQERC